MKQLKALTPSNIIRQLNHYASEAQAKELVSERGQILERADEALVEAETKAAAGTELEGNEQTNLQPSFIKEQRKALLQVDADLLTAQQLVGRREELLNLGAEVSDAISDEHSKEDQLQEKLTTAQSALTLAEAEVLAATTRHESLISAADAIRGAVATIAAHLHPDRNDCPLCGIYHGADVLQKRVDKALQALDPEVAQAAERLKTSKNRRDECKNALVSTEAELAECRRVRDAVAPLLYQ